MGRVQERLLYGQGKVPLSAVGALLFQFLAKLFKFLRELKIADKLAEIMQKARDIRLSGSGQERVS